MRILPFHHQMFIFPHSFGPKLCAKVNLRLPDLRSQYIVAHLWQTGLPDGSTRQLEFFHTVKTKQYSRISMSVCSI